MEDDIRLAIDKVIRPLVEADGGQIEFVRMDDDEIVIALGAGCSGCPGQSYTKGYVIEPIFQKLLEREVKVRVEPLSVKAPAPKSQPPAKTKTAIRK